MAGNMIGRMEVLLQMKTIGLNQAQAQIKGIAKTTARTAGQVNKSFGAMMRKVLDWRQFMAKVLHYITFSIGVQMVMTIRRGIESTIDIFKRFEESVVNAAAVSGHLGDSFDDAVESISKLTRELASKTIFTATEVAKAMYSISSAGIDPVKTSTEELIPILQYATATQTDLEEATKYVITTLKQFKMGLEDTGEVVDTFTGLITNSFMTAEKMANAFQYVGQVAGELNQDFAEVASVLTLLVDRGYTGAQAGQRLNMMFVKMLAPTEKAKRELASLGLSFAEIDPSVNSIVDVLHKLNNAHFSVANSSNMFRARTAAAAATLVSAVDEIEEYVTISKEMGGITEYIAEKQMDTFSGKLKQLAGDAEELAIGIGEGLAGAFMSLKDSIVGVIKQIPFIDALWGAAGGEGGRGAFGGGKGPLGSLAFRGEMEALQKAQKAAKKLRKEAFKDLPGLLRQFGGTTIGFGDMLGFNRETDQVMMRTTGALGTYVNSLNKVNNIRKEMAKYQTEEQKNTKEYLELQLDLVEANNKLADAEAKMLSSSDAIITSIMKLSTEIESVVLDYKNLYEASSKVKQIKSRIQSLSDQQEDLANRMAEVSESSEEYATLLNRYTSVTTSLGIVTTDLADAITDETEAQLAYDKAFAAASATDQEHIQNAVNIIDLRGELLRAQQEYNQSMIEYNRLMDIQANFQKYLAEASLDLYDAQDKLLEIELKRYKLAEDKNKLDDDLFDQLAEQGLLTDDIIEKYKDWQQAEGALMGAQAAYARGDISLEELQTYIDAAESSQTSFSNAAQTTAQHYMDIGIASNDVATTLTGLLDAENDAAQLAAEWELAVENVAVAQGEVNRLLEYANDNYSILNAEIETANTNLTTQKGIIDGIVEKFGEIPDEIASNIKTNIDVDINVIMKDMGFGKVALLLWRHMNTFMNTNARGGIYSSPTAGIFGEAGKEALVPLEGANKKYGSAILSRIIRDYPELVKLQHGGIFGGGGGATNVTNRAGDSYSEAYTITGPVSINANKMDDFMTQLKYKSRVNKRY